MLDSTKARVLETGSKVKDLFLKNARRMQLAALADFGLDLAQGPAAIVERRIFDYSS